MCLPFICIPLPPSPTMLFRFPLHTFLGSWQAHHPLHLRAGSYTPLFRCSVPCSMAVEHCATSGQGQRTFFNSQPKKGTMGTVSRVFYQPSIVLKKLGSLQSSLSTPVFLLSLTFLTQHPFHIGPCQ